jgi:hypothetical protein
MARTRYSFAGVALDLCAFDWPMYGGTAGREVHLVQSMGRYRLLREAIKRAKFRCDLKVTFSAKPGTEAPAQTIVIPDIRVLSIRRNSDRTCLIRMMDARRDLEKFIAEIDANLSFRGGTLEDTEFVTIGQCLQRLFKRAEHLFQPKAFTSFPAHTMPADKLMAGMALGKPVDDLLSIAGVRLWCDQKLKLGFADRTDVKGYPLKNRGYSWVIGAEPGWLHEGRLLGQVPRKLRFYYRRRHALLAEVEHDRSQTSSGRLGVVLRQRYSDAGEMLTLDELLTRYEPAAVGIVNDTVIGNAYMTDNFEGTAIERDGSDNRDKLIRIIKSDWRTLYEVAFTDPRMKVGGLHDLQVGVFKVNADGVAVDDVSPVGAIFGQWAEFFSVLSGAGPGSILNQSAAVNHLKAAGSSLLPAAAFTATWENEAAGIIRLRQQKLPDDNLAVNALIRDGAASDAATQNPESMRVTWQKTAIQTPTGAVSTRWKLDAPSRTKAKLKVTETVALLVGTQRLPNDLDRFEMIELDGVADGDVDFQEFEVPEQAAIFDYVDFAKVTPGNHPLVKAGEWIGQWLNRDTCMEDAESRRATFMKELERGNDGAGVAAGMAAFENESVAGPVDSITLQIRKRLVFTEVSCQNLGVDPAQAKRADRRREAAQVQQGGKVIRA